MTIDIQAILAEREAKDMFARSEHSPFPPESRDKFTALSYFEPTAEFYFEGESVPVDNRDETIIIEKTLGQPMTAKRFGYFYFEVDGIQARVTIHEVETGELGISFKDATSGKETYGGGRFLTVERLVNGKLRVDFNRAINPLCAYLPNYSCQIPPAENHLNVPIRAGEKKPQGDWLLV